MSDDPRVERIRERLEEKLGDTHDDIRYFTAGGMSWLYRARHHATATERVIKVLRPVSGDTESDRQRFLGEARVVAGLHHPAICRLWQVGEDPDAELTWMELAFIEGEDLRERLLRGKLSLEDGLVLAEALTGALAVVHAEGLIHRDLKPANVLLDTKGHPYVTDFGLARRPQDPRLTQVGTVAGTPLYMSPEQQRGSELDTRADVFSLGCILYEAFTGVHPFGNVQPYLDDPTMAVPPPRFVVDMPDELDRLLCDMLAFEPDRRPASAKEVLERLLVLQGKAPAKAPESGASFTLHGGRSRRVPLIVGATVGVALLAAVFLWMGRGGDGADDAPVAGTPPITDGSHPGATPGNDGSPGTSGGTDDPGGSDPGGSPGTREGTEGDRGPTDGGDIPDEGGATSGDEGATPGTGGTGGAGTTPAGTTPADDAGGPADGAAGDRDEPVAAPRDVLIRIDIDGLPAGDAGLEPILFVNGDRRGYLRMVPLRAATGQTVRLEPRKRGVVYDPPSLDVRISAGRDTLVATFRAVRR